MPPLSAGRSGNAWKSQPGERKRDGSDHSSQRTSSGRFLAGMVHGLTGPRRGVARARDGKGGWRRRAEVGWGMPLTEERMGRRMTAAGERDAANNDEREGKERRRETKKKKGNRPSGRRALS